MSGWLTSDEQLFWRSFLHAATQVFNRLDDSLQESSGIPLTDYEILVILSEAPDESMRMSELADEVLISRSRLTYRVDQLISRGFVVRMRSSEDGRGMLAILTESGLDALATAAVRHVDDVRRLVIDHLNPEEIPKLTELFERIYQQATLNQK